MCLEPTCASRRCARKRTGIELLEYLALVTDGFPIDEQANDVVHRQTVLLTRGADAAARQLHSDRVNFVSSGVMRIKPDSGIQQSSSSTHPDATQ